MSISPPNTDLANGPSRLVDVGLGHMELPEGIDSSWVGRVRRLDRGECDLIVAEGDLRVASDSQRGQSDAAPATGDWVRFIEDPDIGPRIDLIYPRRTALVRRDPAEEVIEQVMVANMDYVGVVCGVDRPANLARIERFLVLATDSGATPLVVVSKLDHAAAGPEWDALERELSDVRTIRTSAFDGTGLDEVRTLVQPHRTLVLLGESGAGKSALVNALVGVEAQQTGEVRAGDRKGRHTTTARELLVMPRGGVLIDTPGIRGVGLWDAGPALERVFSDVSDLARDCRFSDCGHEVEPGCAVRHAAEVGELDSRRLIRFLRLRAELEEQAELREDRRRKARGRRRRPPG